VEIDVCSPGGQPTTRWQCTVRSLIARNGVIAGPASRSVPHDAASASCSRAVTRRISGVASAIPAFAFSSQRAP